MLSLLPVPRFGTETWENNGIHHFVSEQLSDQTLFIIIYCSWWVEEISNHKLRTLAESLLKVREPSFTFVIVDLSCEA